VFFSDLLLPHEVAHQWWGNVVTPATYRANWLLEAMANDAALQILKGRKGEAAVDEVLDRFRNDLLRERNGNRIESAGPVDFGQRLIPAADASTWHTILYEKGTWILEMLRHRLGNENFLKMQLRLLDEFGTKPVTNEDFRRIASEFVPPGQPDSKLELFFDTWVYGTGIPRLTLQRSGRTFNLEMSGVDPDFTADVPLVCSGRNGKAQTRWVRSSTGSNIEDSRHGEPVACRLPSATDFLYVP
jgi:aminopeptidase N